MTKIIYLWCSAMGTGSGNVNGSTVGGDVMGYAMAEDGEGLGSHLSSNSSFSKHDMGLTSDWKHEAYDKHYPDGFELVWLDDPESDTGWVRAFDLNKKAQVKA